MGHWPGNMEVDRHMNTMLSYLAHDIGPFNSGSETPQYKDKIFSCFLPEK